MTDPLPDLPSSAAIDDGWRPLPPAARTVAQISGALLALPVAVGLTLAGARYGRARWGRTRWRLDARGLQVCRGVVWRSEVLVPRSRVQHLDIERGPIERRFGLATLVVHTAGTRLSALRQAGFLDADAVALRDALLPEAADDDL